MGDSFTATVSYSIMYLICAVDQQYAFTNFTRTCTNDRNRVTSLDAKNRELSLWLALVVQHGKTRKREDSEHMCLHLHSYPLYRLSIRGSRRGSSLVLHELLMRALGGHLHIPMPVASTRRITIQHCRSSQTYVLCIAECFIPPQVASAGKS